MEAKAIIRAAVFIGGMLGSSHAKQDNAPNAIDPINANIQHCTQINLK